MIEQNYNLDTIPFSSAVPVVHVSQYDSGSRTLKFKLLAGGSNYDMTGVTGAQINGKKPDGTEFSYNMTISNDVVSIVITEQMAAVSGRVMAEVVLTGANSSVLGTANFIIEVEESPIDEGVISDTDVPIIMDFVTGGTPGQIFKRTATGGEWVDDTSGGGTASDVTYDNTDSGLTATNVQDAIDETVDALNTGLSSAEEEIDAINTSTLIEDKEPYLFKSSARENVVGNLMNVQKIVGGTVAWNQLVQNGNFADGKTGWTSATGASISASDNIMTITCTVASNTKQCFRMIPTVVSYKYFVAAIFKSDIATRFMMRLGNIAGSPTKDLSANIWTDISGIVNATTTNSEFNFYAVSGSSFETGDKYYVKNAICIDLTQMFGSTIADYIYSLEQSTAGAGVAFFRKLFPNDYYAYNTGELISVKTSAHVMRDANNNIIGNYALDADLELRGIPKIANGKLYYDGDEYAPSGTVTRKYEKRAYQSGDESLADAITDGTNTVAKLATHTTETADAYDKQQVFDVTGTEEYVDTRTVPIPVGHDTFFPTSLTSRIDALEDEFNEEITSLSESIAPTETSPATATHASGTYLMYQNRLYKVIASIAVGETLTVGTNIQATTIMEELLALTA